MITSKLIIKYNHQLNMIKYDCNLGTYYLTHYLNIANDY